MTKITQAAVLASLCVELVAQAPQRPMRPGVPTPGVKREISAITPAAVFSLPGTPDWQVVTDDNAPTRLPAGADAIAWAQEV